MDSSVWDIYAKQLLKFEIESLSVLLLDSFDCHVSEEGQRVIVEETCASVCPLPENATSVCQPLDVGVMGPLKRKIRSLWLREGLPRIGSANGKKRKTTAKEMRRLSIERTIKAWDQLSGDLVEGSFHRAIPQLTEAVV